MIVAPTASMSVSAALVGRNRTARLQAPLGAEISLEQMLVAREARVARQQGAMTAYQQAVLSISLVTPGPIKDTANTRFLLACALQAVDALLQACLWHSPFSEVIHAPTGAEALYVVSAEASAFKHRLITLETQHPLGRLWDLDVICPVQGNLSRQRLGAAPRSCLLCGEPAHACARSRAHDLDELIQTIQETIDAYRAAQLR